MAVVNNIIKALEELNGCANLESIYNEYKKITGSVVKSTIRRTLQQFSSDTTTYTNKADYFFSVDGLGKGNWGLRNYIIEIDNKSITNVGNQKPERKEIISKRIIRNTVLANQVKNIVGNHCQICNTTIKLNNNKYYTEAHHIQPLGSPHNGPDIKENILVVCPNCHIKCDYAVILLDINRIYNNIQGVSIKYINYHNNRCKLYGKTGG